MVALGNLSPPCGPVVAWPLLLLSLGSDGIGLERTRVPVGTHLIARRGIWSVKSLPWVGERESWPLRGSFSGHPGFTVHREEPAHNSLSLRLGQLEKAAETTQSTVGKAFLNREEGVVQ